MTRHMKRWGTAIAAALFLFVTLGVSYVSLKPYGVVSLDVNPSIEFTINRFDRVLNVNGVNDDGRGILSCIDARQLIHKNIEQAIDITIDTLRAEGYLKEEKDNYVVVAANTNEESHTDKLVVKLDESISRKDNVESIAMKASDDELMAAREMGTTAGKMMIVAELDKETDEDIDKDEWLNKNVASIVKETKVNKIKQTKNKDVKEVKETTVAKNDIPTATPAPTAAAAEAKSTTGKTVTSAGKSSDNSGSRDNNTGNTVAMVNPAATGTQASSGNSRSNKAAKSAESTAKKSTTAPIPSLIDTSAPDVTSVGTSGDTPAATPVPTAAPVTDPLPTAAPTELPVASEPVATAVPTPTAEIPATTPTTVPTETTPQPSEPAPAVTEPSTPAPEQPSEPTPVVSEPSDPGNIEPAEPTPVVQEQSQGQTSEGDGTFEGVPEASE